MLDGDGHFAGVAAKEMEEETGIQITEDQLIDLTQLAYGDQYRGIYPSPGGCDEFIRLFAFKKAVAREELQDIEVISFS